MTDLKIGCNGIDRPIIFGISTSEIARFTGGTLSADSLAIKYTTDATSSTAAALTVAGGLGVAKTIWAGELVTSRRAAVSAATIATTGAIAALASGDGFTRLTGAAPDVQGIAAPVGGAQLITLYCVNATTLRNENGTASAANRIASDTGADISVSAGKTVQLIYDPTSSRWRPVRY
jgi:hypothetical protein